MYEMETAQARCLAMIDAALAPAVAHTQGIGTAALSDLGVLVRCFRQALSLVVYGPGPEPSGESLDVASEQDAAALQAQREAAPQPEPQPVEDEVTQTAPVAEADPLS